MADASEPQPQRSNEREPSEDPRMRWGLVASVVALALAIAHMYWPKPVDNTVILLCLLAIAPWILPFLSRYVQSVEAFGAKFTLLQQRIDATSRKLDELYLLSIGGKLVRHLTKLSQPAPHGYGRCFIGAAVPRELEYLENLGYIEFAPPLKGLDDFIKNYNGRHVPNLSDVVRLTEAGRLFHALRERSLIKHGTAPEGAREPRDG